MAGGVVTGKLLAPVTSAAGTALANAEAKTGPATALVLLMQLSPDATVAIANILNVQGAEELDQVMLLYTVEEGMSELEDVELGQFDPMRPP